MNVTTTADDKDNSRVMTTVFRLLTDFVCLYNYEF